jgi:hypothetical protein
MCKKLTTGNYELRVKTFFWVVMLCRLIHRYQCFGETYCLCPQGWSWRHLVFTRESTQHHNPQEHYHHFHHHKNLKSHNNSGCYMYTWYPTYVDKHSDKAVMRINKHILRRKGNGTNIKARVKQLVHLHHCLTLDSACVHLSEYIVHNERESSTQCGNRNHSQSIEKLYWAAMGRSLPETDTVHIQIHVPDTTRIKET